MRKEYKFNYVYRITNLNPKDSKKYYYGVKSSDKPPLEILGIKYFSTSSDKNFIKEQKVEPNKFKYKVIKLFSNRKDANKFEEYLLTKINAKSHPFFYNKSNGTPDWDRTGIKDSVETRLKKSNSAKGKTKSKEHNRKNSESNKGRIAWNKGKKTGPKSKKEKRKISQTLMGHTAWNKGKSYKTVICPHCNKEGGGGSMKQWHFDNCKFKLLHSIA